jgi:hypothetical protein
MKNVLLIAATTLILANSSMVLKADPVTDRFGAWDFAELGCSGDKARLELCVRLFTIAADLNTVGWLAALNASPIEVMESPLITAATPWINGTPPEMDNVMAFGNE